VLLHRVRAYLVFVVIALAGCDLFNPPGSDGFPRYEVTDLSALVALDAPTIVGVNDEMQVVGHRLVDGVARGFFWDDGTLSELDCLPTALNAKGQVGCIIPTDSGDRPGLWESGTLTQLMPQRGSVTHMSDSGHVVGIASARFGGVSQDVVYRWRAGILALGYVSGPPGKPNNAGDVPFPPGAALNSQARVWYAAGGMSNDFGSFNRWAFPKAINDSGTVVGRGERVPVPGSGYGTSRAFVAPRAALYVEDSIGPSDASDAVDINNLGFVIGQASGGTFLWRAGVFKPIADLLETPEWIVTSVISLTPEGRILARAEISGRKAFVVLTPLQ
jgi:uncharacterized membrane protein